MFDTEGIFHVGCMIPLNGEPEINWAVMVRRKQSASVMEWHTEHYNISLSVSYTRSPFPTLWLTVGSQKCLVLCATRLPFVYGTYQGIHRHQSSSCPPVSYIIISDTSTATCMAEGVSPLPPSHIIHSRINKGKKQHEYGEIYSKRGNAASNVHIQ